MGLGILEDKKLENVPGTVRLTNDTVQQRDPRYKYDDTAGPPGILLVPQPTDDPNDPLNWPLWKRDMILFLLCLISIMAATLGPIMAANAVEYILIFQTDIHQVALLTGYHLVGVGLAGFFFVASARIWGKRHAYLIGAVLLVVGAAWGGAATTHKSFLWARILQGVAVCPFEALVNTSVGDLYPVHKRGTRMALSNLCLYGGAFFTPVLVGVISKNMSWRWTFWFVAIFSGVLLPTVVLFVPETAYRRPAHLNIETTEVVHGGTTMLSMASGSIGDDVTPSETPRDPPKKATFLQSLKPFNGRKTDDTYWKLVLRPLALLVHPAIIWAMLTQGTLIGWTVMIGVDLAFLFSFPPISFTSVETGYTYAGAFIGGLIGFLLSGLLANWSMKKLTALNNGVYEPEFRLVLVIPMTITGALGLFGLGFSMDDLARYGWLAPTVFFGFEVMGMLFGAVASALYIIDAHRDIAIEAFTCMLLFKNFFSFAITWIAWNWFKTWGVWEMFATMAGIQIGVGLLAIPMYIFGKRNRSLMYRHNLLRMTGLVDEQKPEASRKLETPSK